MVYIRFLLPLILILSLCCVSANIENLGVGKVYECVQLLQSATNSTYSNVTTISYPNKTIVSLNQRMTKNGYVYNYSFCDTSNIGEYIVNGITNVDGVDTNWAYNFEITGNGQEPPSGAVITLFIIMFLFVLLFATYMMIYSFGHALSLDFDIIDLAWNYGIFFVLVGMKLFENSYLGSIEVGNFLTWAINIGIFTIMILPTIYFILTLTIGTIMKKRIRGVDFGN